MDLKDTYNRIAEDWVKDQDQDSWWKDGAETFAAKLPPGGTVLDIGCGGGLKSKFFADKGFKVVGADLSEKMIEIAKRENSGMDFRVADIRDPSSIQETFDGILAQAVLLHIPKAEAQSVVRELVSKLNSGGYLYLTVKETRPDRPEEGVLMENDYGYDYERFFSYFTMPELEKYVGDAGCEVAFEDTTLTGKTRWLHLMAWKGGV